MRPCFGKTAILSLERVSNRTCLLYSDGVSKYFCMEQSLASIVLQLKISSNTSRMLLDCSEIRNVSGRVRVQNSIETFPWLLLLLPEEKSNH